MTTLEKELAPGVDLRLEMTDDAELRVMVMETSDGTRSVYSATHTRDFYTNPQKRNTIANELKRQVSSGIDGDTVKQEFKRICSELDSKHDQVKEKLRTPAVDQLLSETKKVEIFGGDPTTITVTLEHEGMERQIEFTSGEWVTPNPHKLKMRYYDVFYERLEISKDEWDELTEAWDERAEFVGREATTERDAIISQVVDGLTKRVRPVTEKEALKNDQYAAWFDEDNSSRFEPESGQMDDDADVLWVRADGVHDQLDQAGKAMTYIGELSKGLKEGGHTFGSTANRGGKRCWPFDPDALGVSRMDAYDDDEDDQSEVDP